jgi:hypothetical protein
VLDILVAAEASVRTVSDSLTNSGLGFGEVIIWILLMLEQGAYVNLAFA